MNLLERYQSGEYEAVWNELQALGPAVRRAEHKQLAQAVAVETMQRVRRNCERLVERLTALGYVFGVYANGSRGYSSDGALVPPSTSMRADRAELEQLAGPLPLSLEAFWEVVGSLDFVGMRRGWGEGFDALVVYPPEAALSDIEDGYEGSGEEAEFEAALAPDDLHKDNVSGGAPCSAGLPNDSADFKLLNEAHGMLFIPYLRFAILQWGGLPGLERRNEKFEPLEMLVQGLDPF